MDYDHNTGEKTNKCSDRNRYTDAGTLSKGKDEGNTNLGKPKMGDIHMSIKSIEMEVGDSTTGG